MSARDVKNSDTNPGVVSSNTNAKSWKSFTHNLMENRSLFTRAELMLLYT